MMVAEIALPFNNSIKQRSACPVSEELYFIFLTKQINRLNLLAKDRSIIIYLINPRSVIISNMSILYNWLY